MHFLCIVTCDIALCTASVSNHRVLKMEVIHSWMYAQIILFCSFGHWLTEKQGQKLQLFLEFTSSDRCCHPPMLIFFFYFMCTCSYFLSVLSAVCHPDLSNSSSPHLLKEIWFLRMDSPGKD